MSVSASSTRTPAFLRGASAAALDAYAQRTIAAHDFANLAIDEALKREEKREYRHSRAGAIKTFGTVHQALISQRESSRSFYDEHRDKIAIITPIVLSFFGEERKQ
ncbi:hypothetical protein [Acidiphilium sp.]|uniref:hypothetical protein n=1 Tax=Acidiphilium sp. TaxID=527 RepID=UPI003D093B7F